MDEVAKSLDLNPNRFGLLGALLGNHILTPEDLQGFHQKLAPELKKNNCKVNWSLLYRSRQCVEDHIHVGCTLTIPRLSGRIRASHKSRGDVCESPAKDR